MNIKRVLATSGVATMIALAIPGIAAAHNASVAPSCRGIGWEVWNYEKEQVNSIVVTVDGTVVHQDLDFKSSDTGSYLWTETEAHTWSIVINAPGTQWDRNFAGTWQPCVAPTTTVEATTTTVAETTTTTVRDGTSNQPQPTTTTVVAVGQPPVPPTTAAMDVATLTPEPALPRTGGSTTILILGAILVASGGAVMLVRRRA